MFIVVAYDIPNDRRRGKVARALTDFGTRVQYSVFECRLDGEEIQKMLGRIGKLIDGEQDRLRVYRLCSECEDRVQVVGNDTTPSWEDDGYLIL